MSEVRSISLGKDNGAVKAVSFLAALDLDAAEKVAESLGVSVGYPRNISTPDECIECLMAFADTGIWPGYLFNNYSVWSIYVKSLAEPRFHKALDLVMSMGGPADLILYLRSCYKFGYQVIPDQEYDALERLYLSTYSNLSYLNEHTNDDFSLTSQLVKDAVGMSGFRNSKESSAIRVSGSYDSLNSEKSTSVKPVRSSEEAYSYLLSVSNTRPDTHWSLKVDGFNTKCLFKTDTGLEVAISRGRASDSWDYTEAISRVLNKCNADLRALSGKVTGESIVDPAALDILRAKYPGKDYKTPKSTAGAMLRSPQSFDINDYQYLHFYPFELEEVPKDRAFELFTQAGLTPPPAKRYQYKDIPLDSLEQFSAWLESEIMDPLWDASVKQGIGSDGVVLQLLTDVENDRADKYSDLNIALKLSHWTEADYVSTVREILFEQRRVEMSVVLVIDPVTTRDLNVATRVSVGSPAILVKDNVRVGDRISFTRKSEAINVYTKKVVSDE